MASLPAAASEGSGEKNKDDIIVSESLRLRLHEAEHTITGLKAAQKATQDFIMVQNADLKKENNQLREKLAVLRSQTSVGDNDGNEASRDGNTALRLEELIEQRGALRELKRQNSEALRQSQELRAYILDREEEDSRKRRRTDSDTDGSEEGSVVIQLLKKFKYDIAMKTASRVVFQYPSPSLFEDLICEPELTQSLSKSEVKANLRDFMYCRKDGGWHCLREVCQMGKHSWGYALPGCQWHGSNCEIVISSHRGNIRFSTLSDLSSSDESTPSVIPQVSALDERATVHVPDLIETGHNITT